MNINNMTPQNPQVLGTCPGYIRSSNRPWYLRKPQVPGHLRFLKIFGRPSNHPGLHVRKIFLEWFCFAGEPKLTTASHHLVWLRDRKLPLFFAGVDCTTVVILSTCTNISTKRKYASNNEVCFDWSNIPSRKCNSFSFFHSVWSKNGRDFFPLSMIQKWQRVSGSVAGTRGGPNRKLALISELRLIICVSTVSEWLDIYICTSGGILKAMI